MELEQLRQMVAIEEEGTMSAAAERLALSQPALSRSVQRLEADLGAELFDHGRNRATMNALGHVVAERGRVVLEEAQKLRDAVDAECRRARALRVGTCAPAPLWNLTARIVERFPGDVLSSETMTEREVEQRVLSGAIDFGISRKPFLLPVIVSTQLMVESLFIAVPPDHGLAKRESVTFADIDGTDFLMLEDIGVWRDVHRRHMPRSRLFLQKDREVYNQIAATSDLPIFVTDIPSLAGAFPDRVRIPISDDAAKATFYLLTREDAPPRVREIAEWVARG
ncbi:LysR family transcriptional regulator [Adlercreutzia sp. R21]|uniref:LysR family transcriptional regulator n=1 Tax=Adlercreutzia wanghongyangiae TaxID=3111451 RepID=UPI002DBE3A35|nr:LysR family transcriptional regulator [Adlercreutzia sp. R21]MEC4184023.1 LysR family transcriptional regulator [Adlercreutzia sp. R21]